MSKNSFYCEKCKKYVSEVITIKECETKECPTTYFDKWCRICVINNRLYLSYIDTVTETKESNYFHLTPINKDIRLNKDAKKSMNIEK